MSALEIILTSVLVLALLMLLWAGREIERLSRVAEHQAVQGHERCVENTVEAVGNRHEANVLRLAADAWMHPAEQRKREGWRHEGISLLPDTQNRPVVERWLMDRADQAANRG